MKNRVKNLFIAGLMLTSMGLATLVRVVPVFALTKFVNFESECTSIGGTVKTLINGQYLCEYTTTQITTSTRVTGSSEADVTQKCKDMGGKIGPNGIKNVAAGAWEGECIPVNPNPSPDPDPDPDPGPGTGTDPGPGTGTNETTVKKNDTYTYTGGLQKKDEFKTSIIDCDDTTDGNGIFCILNIGLTVLTWGVGIAGTLGIVIVGIQYLTARDSVDQMTKAKNRLINVIIGLVVYAVMWGFLNWLIPGGLF